MRTVLPLVAVTCAVFTHPVVIAFEDVRTSTWSQSPSVFTTDTMAPLSSSVTTRQVIAAQLYAGASGAVTTTRRLASAAGAAVAASRLGAVGADCAEVTTGASAATRPSGSTRRGIVMSTF